MKWEIIKEQFLKRCEELKDKWKNNEQALIWIELFEDEIIKS